MCPCANTWNITFWRTQPLDYHLHIMSERDALIPPKAKRRDISLFHYIYYMRWTANPICIWLYIYIHNITSIKHPYNIEKKLYIYIQLHNVYIYIICILIHPYIPNISIHLWSSGLKGLRFVLLHLVFETRQKTDVPVRPWWIYCIDWM